MDLAAECERRIDPGNLASYDRNGCPVCIGWNKTKVLTKSNGKNGIIEVPACTKCGHGLESTPKGQGYESQRINHWHFRPIGPMIGRTAIHDRLCAKCCENDYKNVYPHKESPINGEPDPLFR